MKWSYNLEYYEYLDYLVTLNNSNINSLELKNERQQSILNLNLLDVQGFDINCFIMFSVNQHQ